MSVIDNGSWEEIKTKLKRKFPELTEADFKMRNDEEGNILRLIEYKLHKTKNEMLEIINNL